MSLTTCRHPPELRFSRPAGPGAVCIFHLNWVFQSLAQLALLMLVSTLHPVALAVAKVIVPLLVTSVLPLFGHLFTRIGW